MLILAVDDEVLGLSALTKAIEKAAPEAEVAGFQTPAEALDFAAENDVYIAFLDIQMAGMKGTVLAAKLKVLKPSIHIVFATGFDSYMGDAFSLHANGYLLKPITAAKVKAELDNIEQLADTYRKTAEESNNKLRFQCFGNFEAFCGKEPMYFKYDKTKELLAYLVSRRGALCSNGEIISSIFEDDLDHDSYLRGLRKDLVDSFTAAGIPEYVITQRGRMGISTEGVSCDYYDFLAGDAAAINSYGGEFMAQYSWGEFINAGLGGL